MSQGQDWNSPSGPAYQQPPGQAYPPPGQNGFPPAVYQQQPYPPQGQGYMAPPAMQVMPKNAALALIISFFIPGVGSMYAGKVNTGVIILVCYIVSVILSAFLIGIPFAIGIWIWGLVDAYKGAQEWNRARGIES
jgi:TM2 domain-containing membrane protein YozV